MKDRINDIYNEFNPNLVNWDNFTSVFLFVFYWIILLIVVISIALLILNRKAGKQFLIGVRHEVRQVEWLKRSELINLSVITFIFIVFSTLFIFAADQGFLKLRNLIIFQ